jgi:hypothetical protein
MKEPSPEFQIFRKPNQQKNQLKSVMKYVCEVGHKKQADFSYFGENNC